MAYDIPDLVEMFKAFDRRLSLLEKAGFTGASTTGGTAPDLSVQYFKSEVKFYNDVTPGAYKAKVTFSWQAIAPTIADLVGDTVDHYMFAYNAAGDPDGTFNSTNTTTVEVSALPVNTVIYGRVYAVTHGGIQGPIAVTIADTTVQGAAPPEPSTPVVSPAIRGVHATWDGKNAFGDLMPVDVEYVELHASSDATAGVDFFPDASTYVQDLMRNVEGYAEAPDSQTEMYVRFVAYNTSGMVSPASTGIGCMPKLLEDGDIEEIDAGKITTGFLNADRIDVGTITGSKLSFDAIDGKTITGAIFRTTATPSRGIKFTSTDFTAYDGSGNATFSISASTGNVTAAGSFDARNSSGYGARMSPDANGGNAGIQFYNGTTDGGQGSILVGNGATGSGGPIGTTSIGSGETVLNSTGRSAIKLYKGGNWSVTSDFGPYDGYGMFFTAGKFNLKGILDSGGYAESTFRIFQTTVANLSAGSSVSISFTYGNNPPSGHIYPFPSIRCSSTKNVNAVVETYSNTGFTIGLGNFDGSTTATSIELMVFCIWTN